MGAAPGEGMRTHLPQDVLEHAIQVIGLARPLVETISRRDRDLGSQLRRALSSVALNVAEALGTTAGNSRLRLETARGSLKESLAAFRVAAAWGYVPEEALPPVLESLDALGGRVFGLTRR